MPFYEYECPHCGYDEEVLQKITDKPLTKCPSCGKKGLKKLMSAPVFRLKGSGWYETDFKGDKENKRNLAGPDKDESKSEVKADAKVRSQGRREADAKPEAAKSEPAKAETAKPAADKSRSTRKARRARNRRPKPKAARKSRR